MRNSQKNYKAFTLSEVMITLGNTWGSNSHDASGTYEQVQKAGSISPFEEVLHNHEPGNHDERTRKRRY